MRTSPLALALSITLSAPAVAAAEAPPTAPIPLGAGESRFWLGGQIESGNLRDASLCDIAAPCPTFRRGPRSRHPRRPAAIALRRASDRYAYDMGC